MFSPNKTVLKNCKSSNGGGGGLWQCQNELVPISTVRVCDNLIQCPGGSYVGEHNWCTTPYCYANAGNILADQKYR